MEQEQFERLRKLIINRNETERQKEKSRSELLSLALILLIIVIALFYVGNQRNHRYIVVDEFVFDTHREKAYHIRLLTTYTMDEIDEMNK